MPAATTAMVVTMAARRKKRRRGGSVGVGGAGGVGGVGTESFMADLLSGGGVEASRSEISLLTVRERDLSAG
jgi:hypothetical protein